MDGFEIATTGALPEQHEDQMQLGFRMIQTAYNAKVQNLEQELRALRINVDDQRNQASALQKKNSSLEVELVEGHQRANQLAEENKELFRTMQQLRKQVQKLEGLKRRVLESMNSIQYTEEHYEESPAYMRDDYARGAMPITAAAASREPNGSSAVSQGARPSPPNTWSTPMGDGAQDEASGARFAGQSPDGQGQVAEGRQFFKQARSNLSYEAFNDLLSNIKRMNNQQQTLEETEEQARRIFGPELQHLYKDFVQLLNRQASI